MMPPKSKSIFDDDDDDLLFGGQSQSVKGKLEKQPSSTLLSSTMQTGAAIGSSGSQSGTMNSNNTKNDNDDYLFGNYVPSSVSSASTTARRTGFGLSDDIFKTDIKSATLKPSSSISDEFKANSNKVKSLDDLFDTNANMSSLDAALSSNANRKSTETALFGGEKKQQSSSSKTSDSDLFSPTSNNNNATKFNTLNTNATSSNNNNNKPKALTSTGIFEKPPLPTTKDLLDNDFVIKPVQQQQQQKESVNSSFADSVDINEKNNNDHNIMAHFLPTPLDHHHHRSGGPATSSVKDPLDDWFNSAVATKRPIKQTNVIFLYLLFFFFSTFFFLILY